MQSQNTSRLIDELEAEGGINLMWTLRWENFVGIRRGYTPNSYLGLVPLQGTLNVANLRPGYH
jgi:hypothetical protein